MTAVSIMRHLPDTSAVSLSERGWTFAHHIAVRTLEEVASLTRVTMALAGVRKSQLPKPLVIPRPGDTRPAKGAEKPPEDRRPLSGKPWVAELLNAKAKGMEVVG